LRADGHATYAALTPMIGDAVDFRVIGENWDETLRLAAPIKAGTVAPSALMRRLAAYPKQNALAKTLREVGRLERTLFTLDWISDPALRRRTNAGLNKGEARNALARAVFFHRLGEIRTGLLKISDTGPLASISPSRPSSSGIPSILGAPSISCVLKARSSAIPCCHIAPLGWEHITFSGDYIWPTEPLQQAFRPLRNSHSESSMPLSVGFWEDSAMTPACQGDRMACGCGPHGHSERAGRRGAFRVEVA
jgi:hypothetical protein